MIDEGSLRFILGFMIPHKSSIGYAKSGLLGGFWIHLLFVNNLSNKCLLILKLSTVAPSYSKIKSFPVLFLLYSYLLYSTRGFGRDQNRSLFRRRLLYLWYHNMKPPAIITEPSNLCSGLFINEYTPLSPLWIFSEIWR